MIKSTVGSLNKWQWRDIALFTGVVYAMYRYGPSVADTIEKNMPTEEEMQKMMEEMQKQMQGGAVGTPMWATKCWRCETIEESEPYMYV